MATDFGALSYRIYSHLTDAERIVKGELPLPKMAILHPTYICNHHCPGCDFRKQNHGIDKKEKRIWTKEDGEHIQRELKGIGIKGVEFSGGGEPLIFKGTKNMIEYFSNNGISTGVLTNGTYLNGEVRNTIVNSSNYVRVSLESGSPEVFCVTKGVKRGGKEFDKVVQNLKEIITLRNEKKSRLDVGIKFTIGKQNYMDMENGIRLGIKLGVDSIQFKPYENAEGIDFRGKLEEREIEQVDSITKELEQLKLSYGNKINVLGNLKKTNLEGKCWLSPLITLIDAVGDVYLCNYYRHRQESHKIGNILKESSFKSLWFSEKHKEAIKNIKKEECDLYNCRFHKYNKIMEKAINGEFFNFL